MRLDIARKRSGVRRRQVEQSPQVHTRRGLLFDLIFTEENMCVLMHAHMGGKHVLGVLGFAFSLAIFASPALAVPDAASIAGKFANLQAAVSVHWEESVQSNCDQQGCRSRTSKIHCEQEEPDAPVRCVMPPGAIQIARHSAYWYRCCRECGWNLFGAISGTMKLSDQAATSTS